ncbi:MAG: DUF2520 domain-containing protein [Clostridia bacterium]|nr:DUF2520 domain-containing protein [Clostridia bacterium]
MFNKICYNRQGINKAVRPLIKRQEKRLREKAICTIRLSVIDETAAKVHSLHPKEAQTGPARRGDEAVMQSQRSLLDEELLSVYNMLSDYILKNR